MKGMIALDIDGTIAVAHNPIEKEVVDFFHELANDGWQFVFITGRTFSWGHEVLKNLPFPYFFAAYNGAQLFKMPEKKVVVEKFLTPVFFSDLDGACYAQKTDYVIYTASEKHAICYYRPHRFESYILEYLNERKKLLQEEWIPLDSYNEIPVVSFPAVKCFGGLSSTKAIASFVEKQHNLHSPVIKDPYSKDFYVLQLTNNGVSKGETVKFLQAFFKGQGVTIAAGDDNNDISMLEIADISIVMETAPKGMLENADVIAPSASNRGIIQGIKQALVMTKGLKS